MNILITGVSGRAGSHLLRRLTQTESIGHVYGLYRTTRPPCGDPRVTLFQHDIAHPFPWSDLEVDAIIHAAALRPAARCEADYDEAIRTNMLGTAHTVDFALRSQVRQFIFLSVQSVYKGDGAPFTEESAVDGTDLYAITKLAAEQIVASRFRGRVGYQTLRLGHMVGHADREDGVLAAFCEGVHTGRLRLHGDGSQTGCFLHLDDLADGIAQLLAAPPPSGIYNLSTETISVGDLALLFQAAAKEQFGVDLDLHQVAGGPGRRFGLSIAKLRAATGWQPRCRMREVVEHLVRQIPVPGTPQT